MHNIILGQHEVYPATPNVWSFKELKKKELDMLINLESNKVNDVGEWRGQNNIGKILMICRDCIANGTEPLIDYELLRRANIHILGERLTF